MLNLTDPITYLELSLRTGNQLEELCIDNVKELVELDEDTLLDKIGRVSTNEVIESLMFTPYTLGMEFTEVQGITIYFREGGWGVIPVADGIELYESHQNVADAMRWLKSHNVESERQFAIAQDNWDNMCDDPPPDNLDDFDWDDDFDATDFDELDWHDDHACMGDTSHVYDETQDECHRCGHDPDSEPTELKIEILNEGFATVNGFDINVDTIYGCPKAVGPKGYYINSEREPNARSKFYTWEEVFRVFDQYIKAITEAGQYISISEFEKTVND